MKFFLQLLVLSIFLFSCSGDDSINGTPTPPTEPSSNYIVINDTFAGKDIVIFGSQSLGIITSFSRRLSSGEAIEAEPLEFRVGKNIFKDQFNNTYDIFGEVISGPNEGQFLEPINSVNSYWFSVAATFPGIEIHDSGTTNATSPPLNNPNWLVPTNFVFQGSTLDFIPSIEDPLFEVLQPRDLIMEFPHLQLNDYVTTVKDGDSFKIYPHSILSYHEIVNDFLSDGTPISVLFCPLIGSSRVWEREQEQTFGVSGLLYNSDLIAFDRENNSFWLQLTGQCINGEDIGGQARKVDYFDSPWSSIGPLVQNNNVSLLSTDTVQDYDYSTFPYNGYKENDDFLYYQLAHTDNRLPNKEIVHAVISDDVSIAKVYRLSLFQ